MLVSSVSQLNDSQKWSAFYSLIPLCVSGQSEPEDGRDVNRDAEVWIIIIIVQVSLFGLQDQIRRHKYRRLFAFCICTKFVCCSIDLAWPAWRPSPGPADGRQVRVKVVGSLNRPSRQTNIAKDDQQTSRAAARVDDILLDV